MTIEEQVYALLSAATPGGVPAARIKPQGDWQNLALPYIVHFPVDRDSTYTENEGLSSLTEWSAYQVSCFAADYSTARAIARAVITALSGKHDGTTLFLRGQVAQYERVVDQPVVHIAVDFQVWEHLGL